MSAARGDSSNHDEDIVDIVWRAANTPVRRKITLKRGGEPTGVSFTVRSMKESELIWCRDQATFYPKERYGDIRDMTGETDQAKFHQWVIYKATIPEDQQRLWDNKAIWKRLNAGYALDVIEALLNGGEQAGVYAIIERISGYGTRLDDDLKVSSQQITPSTELSTSYGTEDS
jgi:hypothetical protein